MIEFRGLKLKNPVMLASGTWGFGETVPEGVLKKVGALVTKGISLRAREGNPPPRLSETPCGLINSIGVENPGIEAFLRDILPRLLELGPPVVVNLFGESVEEFAELVKRLQGTGVGGVELNISCPNVKKGGLAFAKDVDAVRKLVAEVRGLWEGFLAVKLSPVGPVEEVAVVSEEEGADALVCANTYPALSVLKGPSRRLHLGGLSGPAIKPLTLRLVYELSKRVSIPIIGCGGITSFEDIEDYFFVGARAVQVGTGVLLNPYLVEELVTSF